MKKITVAALMSLPILLLADMDRCVSCHGVDFEVSALGKSKIVKDMNESQIKEALDNYKAGKGGKFKEIMIQEVNLGVDTDAMAADVYNEIHTPGFEEPKDSFILKKRFAVKSLHKIKMAIKNMKEPKNELKKVLSQMKATAFTMYVNDPMLHKLEANVTKIKPLESLKPKEILEKVSKVKKCVDHAFEDDKLANCEIDFINLNTAITKLEAKKMLKAMQKNRLPKYTGEGAVKF